MKASVKIEAADGIEDLSRKLKQIILQETKLKKIIIEEKKSPPCSFSVDFSPFLNISFTDIADLASVLSLIISLYACAHSKPQQTLEVIITSEHGRFEATLTDLPKDNREFTLKLKSHLNITNDVDRPIEIVLSIKKENKIGYK